MVSEAFFLPAEGGGRFCLVSRPTGPSAGALLYVPPFAEELNKTRRMAALAARAFAERGWTVLQIDLFGTGDSAGDFGEATWEHWLTDIDRGWSWLQENATGTLALWSLRGGALLASDWMRTRAVDCPWLIWQPVLVGRQHLAQFLRLKSAAAMLSAADSQHSNQELRNSLADGHTVEVAGYRLNAELARGMEAALVVLSDGRPNGVSIIEVTSQDTLNPSPALARFVDHAKSGVTRCIVRVVSGAAFWQTVEVEVAPSLIEASLTIIDGWAA